MCENCLQLNANRRHLLWWNMLTSKHFISITKRQLNFNYTLLRLLSFSRVNAKLNVHFIAGSYASPLTRLTIAKPGFVNIYLLYTFITGDHNSMAMRKTNKVQYICKFSDRLTLWWCHWFQYKRFQIRFLGVSWDFLNWRIIPRCVFVPYDLLIYVVFIKSPALCWSEARRRQLCPCFIWGIE